MKVELEVETLTLKSSQFARLEKTKPLRDPNLPLSQVLGTIPGVYAYVGIIERWVGM